MTDPVMNFAKATVSTTYISTDTTIELTAGQGAKFPAAATADTTTYFNVVWYNSSDYPDPADDPDVEIVRVTNRSTDTLTVTRAQEGTAASNKDTAGKIYKMILAPTAKTITDLADTRKIWLPAESAYLPATNPAALSEVAGATVYGGWSYLAFDDTTSEHAIWRVPVPDYDGGNITVTAFSKPATTPAGAVTLQYDILTIGLANSEAFDSAVTVDTTVNISHALDTTELQTDICIASAIIDPANVAADDLLIIEIARDVTTDTLVGDGQLLGILLEYTRT